MPTAAPSVSIVLPIYNEAENLAELIGEINQAMAGTGSTYEILCVDDASKDGSMAALKAVALRTPQIRILRHRVNSGQSAAVATGFAHARGDTVITMDADRQNDPADLPSYLAALQPGVDCVCGIRRKRQDSVAKRYGSRIANRFRNWITGESIRDAGCGFRAMRRTALHEIPVFNGMHRFVPTLMRAQGYCVIEIEINHRPRTRGKSKYGINDRLWRGIRDCFAMRWYRCRAVPGERFLGEEPPAGGA